MTEVLRPGNGTFDVVVLASGGAGHFPGTDGILAGRLVYTVHVRAGMRTDWILQFSLPKSMEGSRSSARASLPVEASYPFRMLRPDVTFAPEVEYLVVHGVINPAGRFEQLEWIGEPPAESEQEAVLQALGGWELRPAKRDGAPVTVEILLIIPGSSD